jgi:hypothetical protein
MALRIYGVCTRTERKTIMMLHKLRIALAVTLLALVAVSAVDSASAADLGAWKPFVGPANDPFFLEIGPAFDWDYGTNPINAR